MLTNTDLCAESWELGYGHVKEKNTSTYVHRPAAYLLFVQENFQPQRLETDWPFISFELRTDFHFKGSIILLGLFAFYDFGRCHGNLGNETELRLFYVLNFKPWIVVYNFNQLGAWKIIIFTFEVQAIRTDIWQHGSDFCLVLSVGKHSYPEKYVVAGLSGKFDRLMISKVQL